MCGFIQIFFSVSNRWYKREESDLHVHSRWPGVTQCQNWQAGLLRGRGYLHQCQVWEYLLPHCCAQSSHYCETHLPGQRPNQSFSPEAFVSSWQPCYFWHVWCLAREDHSSAQDQAIHAGLQYYPCGVYPNGELLFAFSHLIMHLSKVSHSAIEHDGKHWLVQTIFPPDLCPHPRQWEVDPGAALGHWNSWPR